jgi:hypothetical protein
MNRPPRKPGSLKTEPLSVLLVEGPTEVVFYERIKAEVIANACPVTIEHIEGLWDVNRKILGRITHKYAGRIVRCYCCLDRESRYGKSCPVDLDYIRRELACSGMTNVLSIDAIIATQMIESWFFHDIDGIYGFLRVPKSQRKPKAYQPAEKCRESHLKELFRHHDQIYREGERAANFIKSLDLKKIMARAEALRRGIELIMSQAKL